MAVSEWLAIAAVWAVLMGFLEPHSISNAAGWLQ